MGIDDLENLIEDEEDHICPFVYGGHLCKNPECPNYEKTTS